VNVLQCHFHLRTTHTHPPVAQVSKVNGYLGSLEFSTNSGTEGRVPSMLFFRSTAYIRTQSLNVQSSFDRMQSLKLARDEYEHSVRQFRVRTVLFAERHCQLHHSLLRPCLSTDNTVGQALACTQALRPCIFVINERNGVTCH
jgi:hypothetical protein